MKRNLLALAVTIAVSACLMLDTPIIGQTPTVEESTKQPSLAQQKIQEVLGGNAMPQTNDGVLEDILGVIRREGSILDGSMLDDPLASAKTPTASPNALPQSTIEQRAIAAEQLLRAARLLSSVDPSETSQKLVTAMRNQATDLLLTNRNEQK